MQLNRLAAKQKRYKDILNYTRSDLAKPELKPALEQTLARYQSALARCWKAQAVTPDDDFEIDSTERELERLFGEARYLASGKYPRR